MSAELKNRVARLDKSFNEAQQEAIEYVEEYVEDGQLSGTYSFECLGQSFNLYPWVGIKDIKREGCDLDAPTTLEEMQERLDRNKTALRCARQAYMALNYIFSRKTK